MGLFPLLVAAALGAPDGHEQRNPLFRELRDPGVAVAANKKVPLPAPTMADGLDSARQQAIIREVAGEDVSVEELLRESQVAPQVLHIRDVTPSDPKAPTKAVDVFFVAYGDLKTVADKKFLDRMLNSNQKDSKGDDLKPAELAKRGITIKPADAKYESYGHVTFAFLDRVEISATGRSFWSETADSVLAANLLDPRFANDADYPCRWRSIGKDDDGKEVLGPPQPYESAGYYVKVTRLAEPKGALFVEAHVVFTEPVGWFNGANLLRSKLPPYVQSKVRAMRRELTNASK